MKAALRYLPGILYLPDILVAVSLAFPAAAIAQSDPQVPAQSAGSAQLSPADRKFVQEAAIGGMLEVELGKLAVEKAASGPVRQFGQRMVDDHSQGNEQLKAIAQTKGIALPDSLDAKHRKEVERLQKLPAAQFDQAYMKLMLEDHQQDIREFRKEATQGTDSNVKSFATSTLPKLHDHLAMAREAAKTAKATDRTRKPAAGTAESNAVNDNSTGAVTNDASDSQGRTKQ